ncbi:MAG: type 4 pilus major pilin [Alphaproteobacteria bacterium]|nr:type 4 pilus major pilin [Alphaproteobacteria bacterium]
MCIFVGITAAVWGGMKHVWDKEKTNLAKEDIQLIVDNVRSLYSGRQLTSTGVCSAKASLKTMGADVFPKDMVFGGYVKNPWNLDKAATTSIVYMCETNPVKMVIRFTNVPYKACIAMLMSTSIDLAGTGLLQINVNSDSVPATAGSVVPLPTAQAKCSPSGGTMDWYFRVSG